MAKLLLLDDDAETLTWVAAALESRGHEVVTFRTGKAALEKLETYTPDLIVADILMPELDGLAFARIVRKHKGIPLIFVSIAKKQAEAVLAGAIGYVQKPATASEIRAAVERALGEGARSSSILVVDDDEDVRTLYRDFLEPPFVVYTAENGQSALDTLHAERVDLAIIDVHMPVMNGAELLRRIRDDPAIERLPVIIQTSDRAALAAPLWGTLHVSQVLDKTQFVSWFESQMQATVPPEQQMHGDK
jgi:CheY-like chemotaxis protein